MAIPSYLATLKDLPSSARLQSLYSDISRQKLSNPTGYQANLAWWRNLLEQVVERGLQAKPDHLVLHVDNQLTESLRWDKAGKPLALPSVITELTVTRGLIPLSDFLSSLQSIYATSSIPIRIASYVLGKPLWWALEQLNIVGESEHPGPYDARWKKVQGDYVVLSVLEKAAEAILLHQRSKPSLSITESLHNLSSFRAEFATIAFPDLLTPLTDLDLKVLLRYLERDKKILVTEKDVIKFLDEDAVEIVGITDVDKGVLEMMTTSQRLQEQIDEIHRKIDERVRQIKEQLRMKRQEMAKSYLRSKKQLEELLNKRLNSLETIQSVLMKMETAAGDIEIMRTYETSTSTLKLLLANPLLQQDHVERTMANMSDALADHAEIDAAIKMGGDDARRAAGVEDVDEDELKAELDALAEEETRREAAEKEARGGAEKEARATKERIAAEVQDRKTKEAERLQRQQLQEMELKKAQAPAVPSSHPTIPNEPSTAQGLESDWQSRYEEGQAEKERQRLRDREEEHKRRARWETEAVAERGAE